MPSDHDREWPPLPCHVQVEPPPAAACRPVNEYLPTHQETDGADAASPFITTQSLLTLIQALPRTMAALRRSGRQLSNVL